MERNPSLSCRGCMGKVSPDELFSFVWQEIKDLFTDCTAIKIPPDEHGLPQQICSECYGKCEQWFSFKKKCQEVNEHLKTTIPESVGQIRLKEEPDEDHSSESTVEDTTEDDLSSYNFGELIEDEDEEDEILEKRSPPAFNNSKANKALTSSTNIDWKCPACSEMIPESIHLREHLKEHYTGEDPMCPICDAFFTRGSTVYPHVISVHLESSSKKVPVVTTKECHQRTLSEYSNRKDGKLICPICNTKHPELWKHISESHVPKDQTQCPLCDKSFPKRYDLQRHLVAHTGEKPYPCQICGLKFTQTSSRNQHVNITHCKKDQSPNKSTQTPIQTHRPAEVDVKKDEPITPETNKTPIKMVQCPVCKQAFRGLQELHKHFVVHTSEKPYECVYCHVSFSSRSNAYLHIDKNHLESPKANGVVVKEGSIFEGSSPWETMGYSVSWVEMATIPPKQYRQQRGICNQCHMIFVSTGDLKEHINTQHRPRKTHPFKCTICNNSFRANHHLTQHMRVHAGKSLKCQNCPALFKRKYCLNNHLKTCSRMPTTSTKRETPTKGKGVFACQQCDKKYMYRRGLRSHFLNHHNQGSEAENDTSGVSGENAELSNKEPTEKETDHGKISPSNVDHLCKECGISCGNHSALTKHIIRMHGVAELVCKCDTCGKGFKSEKLLKMHRLIHRVVAPYSCKTCKKRFNQLYHYKVHMKKWHNAHLFFVPS